MQSHSLVVEAQVVESGFAVRSGFLSRLLR
jgi:hypothetical protein